MNTPASSTIVQCLWKTCNGLRDGQRLEAAVEAGLKRAARLRHIVPEGEAVLRSAFEGRLSTDSVTDSRTGAD